MRRRPRITRARLRELLEYNDETGEFRWRKRMNASVKASDVAGTLYPDGYRRIRIKDRQYRAHHLVWLYMTGRWCSAFIDHRDGDPSNNRWNNLRRATASQNRANARRHRNNACGLKGVSQHRSRWRACIRKNRRTHHLGIFSTAEEAHAAYVAAARRLFGEFARAE